MTFNQINKTAGGSFNSNQMSLSLSKNVQDYSIYWMTIGVDAPANTKVYIALKNVNFTINANHTIVNVTETLMKNGVLEIPPQTQLTMISSFSVNSAYWSGFRLDTLFCPLVAFRAVRTTSVPLMGQIIYDLILVNEGGGFQVNTSAFLAPLKGIYVFAFSGGLFSGKNNVIDLIINNVVARKAAGGLGSALSSEMDMVVKTAVLALNAGDIITVNNTYNRLLYSDSINQQIAFSGYFHNPINKQQNFYVSMHIMHIRYF